MGRYTVTTGNHPHRPSRLHVALACIVAAAVFALAAPTMRIGVTVGGEHRDVPLGATVGNLLAEDVLQPLAGDLLDVEGEVLEVGGGRAAPVFHNGRVADPSVRLSDGDRLTTRRGSDVTESLEVTYTPIPVEVLHTGKGPLVSLENPGVTGVRETVLGEVSGKLVSTRIAEPMRPMVVRRWVPEPGSNVVALTFDDGPWPGHTEAILDILAEHEVHATFFPIGYLVERYPDVARRMVDEGHSIGNHTYGHPILTRVPLEAVTREMIEGNRAIRDVTAVTPTWFRPPGGAIDSKIMRESERLGMKVVMWDVDPQDWRRPGTQVMLDRLLAEIKPGSVVLLHDGGGDRSQTVELLPPLIEELKERGYVFLTIDELVR